jgi:hypothetical protein
MGELLVLGFETLGLLGAQHSRDPQEHEPRFEQAEARILRPRTSHTYYGQWLR